MTALIEVDEVPLAILLFHDTDCFPVILDYAIEEGFADLVLFLSEADKLRSADSNKKGFYIGYSRIYNTYLCKEGGVMDCVKKYGISHASLKEMIECRIPVPTMFAALCDCIWKEISIHIQKLPRSTMWASVRRAVIEDKQSMELINILSHAYTRKFYEKFITGKDDEVLCLDCWLEVYTVVSFIRARTNGVPMPGTYDTKNTEGEQLKKALNNLYFEKEKDNSRKHTIHERFKMAENSAVANSAAGGEEWDFDSKLVYILSSAREIQKAYFPSNAAETKHPFPAGVSKTVRLDFTALIRNAQSVRVGDIESLDSAYATKLSTDLFRALSALQSELFQHLQSNLSDFFDSVEYVMMVATMKAIASPAVNEYYRKMTFLDGEVRENSIIRWNHPRAHGMTHVSCMKHLTERTAPQLTKGKLRDIYLQFAPSLASQIRALRRSGTKTPSSILRGGSCSPGSADMKEPQEFAIVLLLCAVPLHILVQVLFMLLMGKAVVVIGQSESHLRRLLYSMPSLVKPFDILATHEMQYFSNAGDFEDWIRVSHEARSSTRQISYLIGASHHALSMISTGAKRKLIELFIEAHLLSSGRAGDISPLSKAYSGDFPRDDNNICVFDVDLGEVYFHHYEETSQTFANSKSEKAEVLMNYFSTRKFKSKAFERLQKDFRSQHKALGKVPSLQSCSDLSIGNSGSSSSSSSRHKKLLGALVERSNRLVELAFARYLSNIILRFLPIHLYNFPKQSVAICDVKSVLTDIIDCHAATEGEGGRVQSTGWDRKDVVRIYYEISDFEIGFASDLITGSRPAFVELVNRGGLYLMQQRKNSL